MSHFLVQLWTLITLGLSGLSSAGEVSMSCMSGRSRNTKIHVGTDYEALVACLEYKAPVFDVDQYMNF